MINREYEYYILKKTAGKTGLDFILYCLSVVYWIIEIFIDLLEAERGILYHAHMFSYT
jgi:hypothetical protein